jgi:hypothetical protein
MDKVDAQDIRKNKGTTCERIGHQAPCMEGYD